MKVSSLLRIVIHYRMMNTTKNSIVFFCLVKIKCWMWKCFFHSKLLLQRFSISRTHIPVVSITKAPREYRIPVANVFLFRYLTACSLKYLHNISSRCTYIYINKILLDTLHFRRLEAAPSEWNVAIQSEWCKHLHRSQRQILQISQCASRHVFCLFMKTF